MGTPAPGSLPGPGRPGASGRRRHRPSSTSAFTDGRRWNHRNTPPQGCYQGQDDAAWHDLDAIALVAPS